MSAQHDDQWWLDDPAPADESGELAQPDWKELPAGDQGGSRGPGTAPADFGEGVFDDEPTLPNDAEH